MRYGKPQVPTLLVNTLYLRRVNTQISQFKLQRFVSSNITNNL